MTKETVLFVDPDVLYLRFLRAVIEKEGIEARYATNAEEAWSILMERPCSLMILAMDILCGNGNTLAMMARELYPDIEIVAVVEDPSPSRVPAAVDVVLPEPVAKPITIAEILQVMKRHATGSLPQSTGLSGGQDAGHCCGCS